MGQDRYLSQSVGNNLLFVDLSFPSWLNELLTPLSCSPLSQRQMSVKTLGNVCSVLLGCVYINTYGPTSQGRAMQMRSFAAQAWGLSWLCSSFHATSDTCLESRGVWDTQGMPIETPGAHPWDLSSPSHTNLGLALPSPGKGDTELTDGHNSPDCDTCLKYQLCL